MVRPTKKTKREKRHTLRFTDEENAIIREKAASAGLGCIDYLRQAGLNGTVTINNAQQQNDEIVFQLVKVGTNLNQIARIANTKGDIIAQEIQPLLDELNAIKRALFEYCEESDEIYTPEFETIYSND